LRAGGHPHMSRVSTSSSLTPEDVDGRVKPGHGVLSVEAEHALRPLSRR
jgi:hypothetical protein